MTRRYTLLDLLRDEPRIRESLSYRDLRLHRRVKDDGRYNVGRDGEQLCVLDVDDFETEGALQERLDDLSEQAETEPAVIEPTTTPTHPIRADGAGVGYAFDVGTLRDAGAELWPLGPFGTDILGAALIVAGTQQWLPAGNVLVALLGVACLVSSTRLARSKGRRAYVEGER